MRSEAEGNLGNSTDASVQAEDNNLSLIWTTEEMRLSNPAKSGSNTSDVIGPMLSLEDPIRNPFGPIFKTDCTPKPGIQELVTGDNFVSNGQQQCLVLNNGMKVWIDGKGVTIEGSKSTFIDLTDKKSPESINSGDAKVHRNGDKTIIEFSDGKWLEIGKNGIEKVRTSNREVKFSPASFRDMTKEELAKDAEQTAKHIAEHGYLTPEAIARLKMNPPAGERLPILQGTAEQYKYLEQVNAQLAKLDPALQLSATERCTTPFGVARVADSFAVGISLSCNGKPVQSAHMYNYFVNI
jgi:hypothetical protein